MYRKVFNRLDRCVFHSSTFGRNNRAMACGLASLAILEDEKLVEQSARIGNLLAERLDALRPKHTFLKEIRGKGLMIAIEFREPPELGLKTAWRLLHKIDKALFPQLVNVPLLSKPQALTQSARHILDP